MDNFALIPETILRDPSTALANSIYSAVIKIFQGEELRLNELYTLNENTRWLLKTDMGSFLKEYFQNQILTKGLSVILDKIQEHEGQRQLLALAEVWDRFFSDVLPSIQAILYPLQGQELTVRQMVLLSFRDQVLIKLSLGDLLRKNMSFIPTSIRQMLLVLQGIQDPRGPSKNYCKLESMVAVVVTPYLWNCRHTSCTERINKTAQLSCPEIRITHYTSEESFLSPLVEQEGDGYLERAANQRRHSMTSCFL